MTPIQEEITQHFARAKEIICVSTGLRVNVSSVRGYSYKEKENSYHVGEVTFWKDGQYAEITKKKCNPEECKKCRNCGDKR